MTPVLPAHRLLTADEMRDAIAGVLVQRQEAAYQSQYDVMVCVRSVAAAHEVFEGVRVEGAPEVYARQVIDAVYDLADTYYDSDGEYTSKGMVGDVASDVYDLLASQTSPGLVDIDRDEVRTHLVEEMETLARLTPKPPAGLGTATVKTEVTGKSGAQYFVRMKIEETPGGGFALFGAAHCSDTDRFPVLQERLEI